MSETTPNVAGGDNVSLGNPQPANEENRAGKCNNFLRSSSQTCTNLLLKFANLSKKVANKDNFLVCSIF